MMQLARPTTSEELDALTGNGFVLFQTDAQAAAVGLAVFGVVLLWEPWVGTRRLQMFVPGSVSRPILRRVNTGAGWSAWG